MATTRLELDIKSVPEVLADIRHIFADMVREVAMDEDPIVARRLCELATLFEMGINEEQD